MIRQYAADSSFEVLFVVENPELRSGTCDGLETEAGKQRPSITRKAGIRYQPPLQTAFSFDAFQGWGLGLA